MWYFLYCLTLLIVFLSFIGFLSLEFSKFHSNRLFKSINNFESYSAVLTYHLDKAYELIYKDKILIYSVEGLKISNNQFNEISKEFTSLVLKMIGKTLQEELSFVYGGEETLLFNIVEYFHTKYENDEIQKSSVEKLTEGDEKSIFE